MFMVKMVKVSYINTASRVIEAVTMKHIQTPKSGHGHKHGGSGCGHHHAQSF